MPEELDAAAVYDKLCPLNRNEALIRDYVRSALFMKG